MFNLGKITLFLLENNAYCELGHMSSLGSNGKLICTEKITIRRLCKIRIRMPDNRYQFS